MRIRCAALAFLALLPLAASAVAQDTVRVRPLRAARVAQPLVRIDVARLIETGAPAREVEQAWLRALERERARPESERADPEAAAAATLRAGVQGALAGPSGAMRRSLWALGGALASDATARIAECRAVQQMLIELLQGAPVSPGPDADARVIEAYVRAMQQWQEGVAGLQQRLEACAEGLERAARAGGEGGEDTQLAQIDLQQAMQKRAQTLAALSSVTKSTHDAAMAVIRNMK